MGIDTKKIKLKYSRIIPFKGFYAIQFFGTVYIRKEYEGRPINPMVLTHENIHLLQALDFGVGKMGFIPFYLLYFIEGIIKLPYYFGKKNPYYELSGEREAYHNQGDPEYLKNRKRGAGVKRILK